MVRTSVIGCGNMGSALLTGLWKAGGHSVVACDLEERDGDIRFLCTLKGKKR